MDRVMPMVYEELLLMARRSLGKERACHTLIPSALVHETYLRLRLQNRTQFQDRLHFYKVAARVMRRVLIDYAREKGASKRGSGARLVTLNHDEVSGQTLSVDIFLVDQALTRLGEQDPRLAQIVELKYFGGMQMDEIARVLKLSQATVYRLWKTAKARLYQVLNRGAS